MNYVCFICKDNISGYKKFENHILNDHNLTLTKYYDIEHNTISTCMKCGNESMFDKKLKRPKQYCRKCMPLFISNLSIWFYKIRGISDIEAHQRISDIQKKFSKKGNDKYSLEKMIEARIF